MPVLLCSNCITQFSDNRLVHPGNSEQELAREIYFSFSPCANSLVDGRVWLEQGTQSRRCAHDCGIRREPWLVCIEAIKHTTTLPSRPQERALTRQCVIRDARRQGDLGIDVDD